MFVLEGFDQCERQLRKRFDRAELPETAQLRLHAMRQDAAESVEAWAERVMTTALVAYPNLPDEFIDHQVVTRFCHGLESKEAGILWRTRATPL